MQAAILPDVDMVIIRAPYRQLAPEQLPPEDVAVVQVGARRDWKPARA